jgi:hypothetical protein
LWLSKGRNVKQKALKSALRPAAFEPFFRVPYQGEPEREHAMRFRPGMAVLVVLAVIFLMAAAPAFAAVCLDKSMTLDEIVAAIDAAPGCDRAMAIFKDCQFGTSGDISLGAAVEKKCEAGFLPRLTAAKKTAYQREMDVCDRKYANEQGTMYRSFTAFCRAEVAQRYSSQAPKARR